MNRTLLIRLALLGGAALALTGCGGGHSSATVTPPPVTTLKLEDTFGTQFGVDYRASPNSQPVKPAAGDIIPLTLTDQPKALH